MATTLQDQAWSILLRELPQYLARPTERQPHDKNMNCYFRVWWQTADPLSQIYSLEPQARDLMAMVLVQKPHAPDAIASHKDAKILLLRMALITARDRGQTLAWQARETYMGRHYRRLNKNRIFARPRPRYYDRDQKVFLADRAIGETERDAKRSYDSAVWMAETNRSLRRRIQFN